MSRHCGFFRASVRLSRSLLEHPQLTRWSVDELVVLFTLQEGAPAYYGLRRTSSWCDMMDVCGSKKVADMLPERTLCVRQEGLATCRRLLAVPTKTMTWVKVHLQSLCLAGALAS